MGHNAQAQEQSQRHTENQHEYTEPKKKKHQPYQNPTGGTNTDAAQNNEGASHTQTPITPNKNVTTMTSNKTSRQTSNQYTPTQQAATR